MAKPIALGEIITSLKRVLAPSVNATVVVPVWREVVGEKLATHCKPKSWSGGSLQVICSSSVWSQVLMSQETIIIERIKKLTKSDIIKGLQIIIRKVERKPEPVVKKKKLLPITHEMVAKSEKVASSVPAELRDSFQRAYLSQLRLGGDED